MTMKETHKLLDNKKPSYDKEELKEIAEKIKITKDQKGVKVYSFLECIRHEPLLFEDWCENFNEKYNMLFFTPLKNINIVIEDMNTLNPVEKIVVNWRFEHNK